MVHFTKNTISLIFSRPQYHLLQSTCSLCLSLDKIFFNDFILKTKKKLKSLSTDEEILSEVLVNFLFIFRKSIFRCHVNAYRILNRSGHIFI